MLPISDPDVRKRRFPIINVSLIVLCTVVFIYELALNDLDRVVFFYKYGLIPLEITQGISFNSIVQTPFPDWLTLFTSMFLHGDWMHFLSNMLYLWAFGNSIE
ncbi:MAG: rhomboid family intramembrane serine protease, partial [Chloroflexi bacterium]|nr:rhomboid family intramembrane serine protease [Chloroflexota bacterium]